MSQGAAAVLEYNAIEAPFAQPRNAILGQFFSALIGVSITKLFQHSPNFENLRWIAGALSVGLASAFMGFTKTVYPPAGATALLCSTTDDITALGWFMLPLVLIGSVLLVATACVLNNIQRRFPVYWWTPADLRRPAAKKVDVEQPAAPTTTPGVEKKVDSNAEAAARSSSETDVEAEALGERITVDSQGINAPDWLLLEDDERAMLVALRTRLAGRLQITGTRA